MTAEVAEKREAAAKALRDILERMGIDAEVSAFDDGERIILDAHGATIHVGRAVPYGAVFTVSIPASQVERTSVAVDGQAYSAR